MPLVAVRSPRVRWVEVQPGQGGEFPRARAGAAASAPKAPTSPRAPSGRPTTARPPQQRLIARSVWGCSWQFGGTSGGRPVVSEHRSRRFVEPRLPFDDSISHMLSVLTHRHLKHTLRRGTGAHPPQPPHNRRYRSLACRLVTALTAPRRRSASMADPTYNLTRANARRSTATRRRQAASRSKATAASRSSRARSCPCRAAI